MENSHVDKRLLEVEFLRPVAILLVVVLHSFTIYWGKWEPPQGYIDIDAYRWIAAASFSFTMELFVLLSGYVFGYQLLVQRRVYTLSSLINNKLKRLILPSLVFGIIYALLFYMHMPSYKMVYSVMNGAGHLWFLPMLFWCFILGFLLFNSRIKDTHKLLALLASVALSIIHLPLRLDKALYYLFFFYAGIFLMQRQDICRKLSGCNVFLFFIAALYLLSFVSYEMVVPSIEIPDDAFFIKTAYKLLRSYWIFTYSLSGTLFVFLLTFRLMQNRTEVPSLIVYCSSMSFGVYVFHQFVIEILYYKTALPVVISPRLLPWAGLIVTLPVSLLAVLLFRRLKLKHIVL